MSKIPTRISGFPEWLPEARRVEQQWLDSVRQVFESHGYASIEPSSVEDISVIAAKGDDVDKEIYGLNRLKATENEKNEPKIALHFDLTVPMARYVSQNFNDLTFPFKRYQIQRAWRGERPQEGRYREFTQADIDVIDNGEISLYFDAEMPRVVHKILSKIGIPDIRTHINNRKILQGYYEGLGINEPMRAISIVDKIDKIGADGVAQTLEREMGLNKTVIEKCLKLAAIKTFDSSFVEKILELGIKNELLDTGLSELKYVMDSLSDLPEGSVCADFSIARGLDYYTGTVYEGKFIDYPQFPTIFAGGRYDNLVGMFLNKKLPGVGISIGLTRIFGKMLKEGRIDCAEKSPTTLLIINSEGNNMQTLSSKAEQLRARNINVEVYHDGNDKTHKQIRYADRKGIPYVLFVSEGKDEIKALSSGEQLEVDLFVGNHS